MAENLQKRLENLRKSTHPWVKLMLGWTVLNSFNTLHKTEYKLILGITISLWSNGLRADRYKLFCSRHNLGMTNGTQFGRKNCRSDMSQICRKQPENLGK